MPGQGGMVVEGNDGQTLVVIPLRLSAPPLAPVRLQYAFVPRSAELGSDFEPLQGTLALAAGQTNAALTVRAIGDQWLEPDEDFRLVWLGPDGVRLPNEAVLVIQNDWGAIGLRTGFLGNGCHLQAGAGGCLG